MGDIAEHNAGKGLEKRRPSDFQRKALWAAVTALSIAVLGALAVGAVLLGTKVLSYLQPVLVPLAVAGILAYLLQPVVTWTARRTGTAERRAVGVVYAGFLAAVVILLVAVLVPSVGQARTFLEKREVHQERAKDLVQKGIASLEAQFGGAGGTDYYSQAIDWISEEAPRLLSEGGLWLWERLRGAFGLFGYLLGFLLVPIYLFFFLREGRKISQTWSDYVPLRASGFKDEVVGTLTEINRYLISFFRGQMVVSLIDGALVALALSLMGLPYALLIGVFLAILGLIPYIGNLLVMIPAVLIAVAHFGATEWASLQDPEQAGTVAKGDVVLVELASGKTRRLTVVETRPKTGETEEFAETAETGVPGETRETGETGEVQVLLHAWNWLPQVWAYPLIVLGIFVVLQQVNGLVTAPKIVGDSVGLHPLTVIFSILFWSLLLGGLLGAILAVPLTAAVKVIFRRYLWENRIEPAMGRGSADAGPVDEGVDEVPAIS